MLRRLPWLSVWEEKHPVSTIVVSLQAMALRLRTLVFLPSRSLVNPAVSNFRRNLRQLPHHHRKKELSQSAAWNFWRTFPNSRWASIGLSASDAIVSSVSQLNENLVETEEDEEVSRAAMREFELVNEDLEAENQRNVDDSRSRKRRKPMCYYFTQGLCTLMEEKEHTDKFNHVYPNLKVRPVDLKRVKEQPFEFYLVLDLEGMVEILEFPVLLIDAKTLEVVDRFHRFVRPVLMTAERQAEYIKGKYGKWGLDRVWHDTAIPFKEVLSSFEDWMESHSLYDPKNPSKLTRAAFVTCGNWDVKTKIPEQCRDSGIDLKLYFNEWINLKDIYYNFYKKRAGGMLAMLNGLNIPLTGTHHVGLDDAHNIARVLQRMLAHGAIIKISAKRKASDPMAVRWTFANRVK